MITNVNVAIIKHLRTLTIETVSGVTINGEYVEITTSGTRQLGVFPITSEELRTLPEGMYDFDDRKFYEIGAGTLNKKSYVIFNSNKYLLNRKSDRDFDGGFTVYFGKKEAIE